MEIDTTNLKDADPLDLYIFYLNNFLVGFDGNVLDWVRFVGVALAPRRVQHNLEII